jgi:hypothetical protein
MKEFRWQKILIAILGLASITFLTYMEVLTAEVYAGLFVVIFAGFTWANQNEKKNGG